MDLPKLLPGKRYTLPQPAGSADALLLAQLGLREKAAGRLTAIVTADAATAQRLLDELAFFAPALRCALFPDWETLPYDTFSPHQDLISERLATLWRISQHDKETGADVVIVPATTALYRLAPPSFLAGYTFHFKVKQKLDEAKLKSQLTLAGYTHVSQVVSPGEYAVRGGLIDLFPMGSAVPYRVDLFDDEIDSIRTFDPDSQRSLYPVPEVRLLPGREFPMDDEARTKFRNRWRELLDGDPTKSRIYKDIGNGVATAGIEYYLPLFFDDTATVFDYLGSDATVVLHGDLEPAFQRFWQDTKDRYRLVRDAPDRPALPPEALFLGTEQFYARANEYAQLAIRPAVEDVADNANFQKLGEMSVVRGAEDPLARLKAHIRNTPQRVLLLAESDGRRESLLDFLRASSVSPPAFDSLEDFQHSSEKLGIATAALNTGFSWLAGDIDFVTETELFAAGVVTRRRNRKQEQVSDVEALIKDLSELNVGDPVVHSAHGIGRYKGLVNMDLGQGNTEFLHLQYADDATLYVPVSQLQQISRYTGVSADEAPLHRLGSGQWEKAKRKAAEQVRDSAAELLNIYARRAAREGHAFRYSPDDYESFANDFGFEETADQRAAIHAVIQDMISPRPMDRLVCGDVGFGKTEVALRAAFIAITGGKQVALLAPTTLLAEQHYQTLVDRFAKWPVKVAEMSRFRSGKEITAAIKGIADGSIDIVVGTHKLLSQDVKFQRLGLLIIDEEHRFGVRHKEAMKAMRAEVDVLTLTATPIPRTLGMALEGLRDLSVIATAPQRRLAIKTFVRSESNGVIREAVLRELKRGGQVYFLHNEVETIQNRREKLEALLPEARIAVAHGQMPERELEKVMKDFVAQRYNLLLCSTIIETGIDVPSANTIVMSRADKFGLAQLHQLRGRVGRSHHQAYAYLMVPDIEGLTKQASQRLEAIQQMEELGSGFYLAMHDLEIRGTGEVLGENQSGNMMEIGFQLYNEMLNEAVASLKAGREPDLLAPLNVSTEINLHAPALLPSDYCGDVHLRLSFYKKLATAKNTDQIDSLLEEIVDRFGKLPAQAQTLIDVHRLRVIAKPYGVVKVDAAPTLINITFRKDPPIDSMAIMHLIQKNRHIKLAGNDKLRIERELKEPKDRAQMVRDVLKSLGQPKTTTEATPA
ncbi:MULTISPECIES: transcription-repair coupling factor [unclassified Polaromonas]|jgi:transcription-repair coupling factor (superfamily II helicase)|uniref:transcription-repair coupling factor n=1 Tax=unclassified Polaromonas TaxID=2638319 RepID=UPI000BD7EF58|nr:MULTISPECIES: transcription-repair coupling factor [unclassified Polaromonas]OYY34535.1 MAG: transcription-repair coupling factor [Polaromonas sp. 35-63-35]OYZ18861.1 MAG: transcription-repair coupling factor [Polaromonas sp. 16-63-31]OYZ78904.1 MAG: transcription-repair coupling factor [Polaromonas sp. 24-63-21]OZA49579.1 MAG: transcription-repair coupling factor [Polaromonas sp. 17-63-33]OZA86876.1 MAG: transcription-repair coupling factor [Polaromonas sp. 39-63-25]